MKQAYKVFEIYDVLHISKSDIIYKLSQPNWNPLSSIDYDIVFNPNKNSYFITLDYNNHHNILDVIKLLKYIKEEKIYNNKSYSLIQSILLKFNSSRCFIILNTADISQIKIIIVELPHPIVVDIKLFELHKIVSNRITRN